MKRLIKNALIVVDVQKDFLKGGRLPVHKAENIIFAINGIRNNYSDKFSIEVLVKNNFPEDHISFVDSPYLNDNSIRLDELTRKKKVNIFNKLCREPSLNIVCEKQLEVNFLSLLY